MAKSNFIIRGGADFSSIQREVQRTQATMTNFQSKLSGVVGKIGGIFAGLAIGKYIKDSVNELSKLQSAMVGLQSVSRGMGRDFEGAQKFINDFTADGLVPATNAITAYKNLLARGYDDTQIQTVMSRLKDSAAFARQGSLSMGEAIQSASEGLKNENSILVDNAGVTKNVAKMWEDYAKSIGVGVKSLTKQQKIQAEVAGIMEETKFQMGDAARYTQTYAGETASLSKLFLDLKVAVGGIFQPIAQILIPYIKLAIQYVIQFANTLAAVIQQLTGKSGFSAVADDTQAIADGFGGVGGSAIDAGDDVAKGAKKAKGALAGFDEINNIQLPEVDGGAGVADSLASLGGVGDIGEFNLPTPDLTWLDTMKKKLDEILKPLIEIGSAFVEGFMSKAMEIDLDPLKSAKKIIDNIWTGIKNGVKKVDFGAISKNLKTIAGGLGEIMANALNNTLKVVESASRTIGTTIEWGIAIGGKGFEIITQAGAQFITNNKEKIMQWQNETAETVSKGFENITVTVATLGEIIYTSLSEKQDQIANTLEGFATTINEAYMLTGTIIADTFEVVTGSVAGFVTGNQDKIKEFVDNSINLFTDFGDTINNISQSFLQVLSENWNTYFKGIVQGVADAFMDIVGWFMDLYNKFVYPIIDNMLTWFNRIWEDSLKGIVDEVLGFVGRIGDLLKALWERAIKPQFDFLVTYIVPIVTEVVNTIIDVVGGLVNIIGGIIKAIMGVINGIIDFLIGVFTGDWEKAWSGIVKVFSSIFNGVKDIVIGVVNIIVDMINGMVRIIFAALNNIIRGINGLNFQMPDWLGGGSFGLNIPELAPPQIPRLAKGGIINQPTLAMVGEAGKEAVMPLENNTGWITDLANQIGMVLAANGGNSNSQGGTIILQVDGRTFAEATIEDFNSVANRKGTKMTPRAVG